MKKFLNYIVVFSFVLIAALSTFAIDSSYKNNLLNVELTQAPDNRVSVLLVFEKPYTDAIKVVYKTDNEYNILLPETYHSVTSVSTINALNVRSASVKLVPYFNQDNANGYTKIILKTTRPVIFNAHSSYVTTKIAQDDLIDKLERDEHLQVTPKTITPTTVKSPTSKKQTTAKKSAQKSTSSKTTGKSTAVKKKATVKSGAKTNKTVKTTTKPVQKTVNKPAQKQVQKPVVAQKPTNAQQTQQNPQPQPQPSKIEQNIPQNTDIQKPIVPVSPVETPISQPVSAEKELSIQDRAINIFKTIKNDERSMLAILAICTLLLFGLLIKMFKKTTKNPVQSTYTPQVEQEQTETEIPQEIQNMSWQEKFKYMKEQEETQQTAQENARNEERLNQIENIYNSDEIEQTPAFVQNTQSNISEIEQQSVVDELVQETQDEDIFEQVDTLTDTQAETAEKENDFDPFGFNSEPINEGFEPPKVKTTTQETDLFAEIENLDDISDLEPEVDLMFESAPYKEELDPTSKYDIKEAGVTNPIEPTLINQARISKTKGFYLIRYEKEIALVGYIKDKVFLIHSFDNMEQSFVQTRLTEKNKGEDIYLVRSNNFKALVQVTKDNMKTIINL